GVGEGHPVPIDGGEAEQLGLGDGGGGDEERREEGATDGERETAREGATGHGASGPGRVNRDGGGGVRDREPAPPMYVIRGSGGFGRPPGGCSRRGGIASGPLAPRNDCSDCFGAAGPSQ